VLALFILYLAGLYIPTLRGFFCTLEVSARLLCSACFVYLLLGEALYFNLARLLSHTQSLGELTLQCLLCEVPSHARSLGELTLQCLLCLYLLGKALDFKFVRLTSYA
jgi:hypothetical protein